ncbi:energy transducer TonB [Pseudoxanthomonas sp. PXM01]|uniref:energy transducer TonB n=1 Tax=Pseudoxanthomonas sp. PXM01 TaxID=2769295 RepID=UPI0017850771|nr:energy transducer TonB [Pseudoxanthomonas sp. PXM01]MBD9469103.1 TonB family protein [Pseudoxanthomonas sp. PXM01]
MKAMWKWMWVGSVLCMTACGAGSPPAAGSEGQASSAGAADTSAGPVPATSYERATRALSQRRMLSPAGDNAVEHYLAARAEATEHARAQAALAELQPYVLIAAEQAIARGDAQEASRLQGLIERIDARAPALPRLAMEVAALAREQAAQVAPAAVAPPAVVVPTAAVPAPARGAGTSVAAPATITPVVTEPVPAAAPSPAPAVVAQDAPIPAGAPAVAPRVAQGARAPRLLQDAQPRYPLPALRARIEGQAEVAFTVQPDGSVRDVRLLSSTPGGMFDASALAVAQRWRFEATGQAHASSRTVRFRLPAGDAGGG